MTTRKYLFSAIALFSALMVAGHALAEQKTIDGKVYECTQEVTNTNCTYDRHGKVLGCDYATIERCKPVGDLKTTTLTVDPGPNSGSHQSRAFGLIGKHSGLSVGG